MLPEDIVWRQKEQFSDGVGYGWIDALKAVAENEVRDDELKRSHYRFPLNPPRAAFSHSASVGSRYPFAPGFTNGVVETTEPVLRTVV